MVQESRLLSLLFAERVHLRNRLVFWVFAWFAPGTEFKPVRWAYTQREIGVFCVLLQ